MAIHRLLPVVGKVHKLIYQIPIVGEMTVRGSSRALGTLAFKTPLFGGSPGHHIGHIKDQLLRFLGLIGLKPKVVEVRDGSFDFTVEGCPYGFKSPEEEEVCDACMDLDRIYVHHLRGRFEIVDRVTQGAHQCRFRVSFP